MIFLQVLVGSLNESHRRSRLPQNWAKDLIFRPTSDVILTVCCVDCEPVARLSRPDLRVGVSFAF